MKKAALAAAAAVLFAHVLLAQISLDRERGPVLTSPQLIEAAGDEPSAAAIVSEALSHLVQSRLNRSRTMIAEQIPAAWLAIIPGVQFIRLPHEAALAQFQHCGRLLWVDSLKLLPDGTGSI